MTLELMKAALNSLIDPFLLVDTNHTILYLNDAAIKHYAKWGGAELVGKSLLACHNETSCATIIEVLAAMREGLDERIISENDRRKIYMRAIRAEDGKLLGYYERYVWMDKNE